MSLEAGTTAGGPTPAEIESLYSEMNSDAESPASPGATGSESPAPTSAPPAPTASSKYLIDGQEYTVDQIKEWRRGGMLLSDYTRKTQEHAQARRQFEAQQRDVIALEQAIKEDPGLLNHLRKYYSQEQEQAEPSQMPDIARHPVIRQFQSEIRALRSERENEQVEKATSLINTQLESLKTEYPSLDWADLTPKLVEAITETGMEPEQLFWTHFRAEALKAHEDKLRRKTESNVAAKQSGAVEPGGGEPVAGAGKPSRADRDRTLKEALKGVFDGGLDSEEG
jgi:hypothetical protein